MTSSDFRILHNKDVTSFISKSHIYIEFNKSYFRLFVFLKNPGYLLKLFYSHDTVVGIAGNLDWKHSSVVLDILSFVTQSPSSGY
jgi:hypothetical protein